MQIVCDDRLGQSAVSLEGRDLAVRSGTCCGKSGGTGHGAIGQLAESVAHRDENEGIRNRLP